MIPVQLLMYVCWGVMPRRLVKLPDGTAPGWGGEVPAPPVSPRVSTNTGMAEKDSAPPFTSCGVALHLVMHHATRLGSPQTPAPWHVSFWTFAEPHTHTHTHTFRDPRIRSLCSDMAGQERRQNSQPPRRPARLDRPMPAKSRDRVTRLPCRSVTPSILCIQETLIVTCYICMYAHARWPLLRPPRM
ncbi:hypothetical protein LY76DRAFT_381675 [Colletotrichum caudatum]|nr:hypothetical protein LY76DRAFT_381675 [Colletotrichum caudatum]